MPAGYGPYRLRITGKLEPQADFRIGSADQSCLYTDMPVLRWPMDPSLPYIPGSSLRGVLRAYLEREHGLLGCSRDCLLSLFGHAGEEDQTTCRGKLRVLDSLPTPRTGSASYEIRDHVCIDRVSGAAANQAKFDAERVSGVSQLSFEFRLIYEGEAKDDRELILLGAAIKALQQATIWIGGRSAIGCGRFRLIDTVYSVCDRKKTAGLLAFIDERLGRPTPVVQDFEFSRPQPRLEKSDLRPLNRMTISLSLRCNGPLLVKAAPLPEEVHERFKATNDPERRWDAIPFTRAGGRTATPIIPGSSLRGVLRTRAEHIANSQRLGGSVAERLFGGRRENGSGRRGLVQVEDGAVREDEMVESDHVPVDRITHAAANKFDDRALDGARVEFALHVHFTDDFEDMSAAALLLMVVSDLVQGFPGVALGSQTTRGYGAICPAQIATIEGSFYGCLIKAVAAYESGVAGHNRAGFRAVGNAAETLFGNLCNTFDEYWQRVRLRVVTA